LIGGFFSLKQNTSGAAAEFALGDRDFLLSPEKRNQVIELWEVEKYGQVIELWEVEKYGRNCFNDPDHVHLYGMAPTSLFGERSNCVR
jgi:hypothetical protein